MVYALQNLCFVIVLSYNIDKKLNSLSLQKLMSITPFCDSLMLNNRDVFKALVTDIKDLKYQLKNEQRRVHSPSGAFTAYRLIKKIADPIVKVFNGRKISDQQALNLFTIAIRKVNLTVRELACFGRVALIKTLKKLEQTLVSLLPENIPVQLELFEVEEFETGIKERLTFQGFRKWKREASYRETHAIREEICKQAYEDEQNKIERLRNSLKGFTRRSLIVVQQSLKLVFS